MSSWQSWCIFRNFCKVRKIFTYKLFSNVTEESWALNIIVNEADMMLFPGHLSKCLLISTLQFLHFIFWRQKFILFTHYYYSFTLFKSVLKHSCGPWALCPQGLMDKTALLTQPRVKKTYEIKWRCQCIWFSDTFGSSLPPPPQNSCRAACSKDTAYMLATVYVQDMQRDTRLTQFKKNSKGETQGGDSVLGPCYAQHCARGLLGIIPLTSHNKPLR